MRMESQHQSVNERILSEAAEWLVEFETGEPGLEARRNFDAWLRHSPEHIRVYLELLPIWKQGSEARFARDAGPDALLAYARAEGNVVALAGQDKGANAIKRPGRSQPRKTRHALIAAVAASALIAAVFWRVVFDASTYSTSVGEQQSIVLPDGSTVELNARSKVRVRFSAQERRIDLLEGQGLFAVAKEAARPFVVHVDGLRVRAIGTQFDIYRKSSGAVVTVLEGRIAVTKPADAARAAAPVYLSTGEQVTVASATPRAISKPRRTDVAAATAWTQRRLVFDVTSLAEVVREFNRYNTQLLVIDDPALETLSISAAFSSTSPASLIRFLEAQPGVRVVTHQDEIRISRR